MVYGEPRLTNDIDLIVELDFRRADALAEAFPFEDFYCPPVEVIKLEARRSRRGHFNLIHHESGYKADVYMCGTDPLQTWGMERRRRVVVDGERSLWIAPPEYVIVRKLEYYREGGSEKHVQDIRGMLDVSGDALDRSALSEWVATLGVQAEWRSIEADS
jgi:hypothetical protein